MNIHIPMGSSTSSLEKRYAPPRIDEDRRGSILRPKVISPSPQS